MKVIITGGAGFIGSNAALRYAKRGDQVIVADNLSRRGAEVNLAWLQQSAQVEFQRCDIRDVRQLDALLAAHRDVDVVLHLAAQVAVTTSVQDPRTDFEINALGTFNVLEAVRKHASNAVVLYASTNKVYGGLEDVGVVEREGRYQLRDLPRGVPETRPLDFHSPYGCSKGAADQYVRDYARIYGLKTVSLRQSCIYGPRQFGVEDQGWVAWFTIASVLERPITIYGDGKQVRDLLHVEDLCEAYDACVRNIEKAKGGIYNLGGGTENQLSLLELIKQLETLNGRKLAPAFSDWRPGDQPVFACDITRAKEELGWAPRIGVQDGVRSLHAWVSENRRLFG